MFETTIAGSLPRPDWLAEPETLKGAWKLSGHALEDGKRRAAAEWMRHEEEAGIDIVTNGEVFRSHFVHGFLEGLTGIDWQKMTRMGIRNNRYELDVPTVVAPPGRPAPVHLDEVRFSRAQTGRKFKFTLPGPMTICDTIADGYYGSRPQMAMAFAEILNAEAHELVAAGADIIQFDEPAFNVFTREVKDWGIEALHRAIEGLDCSTAVHICYGYGIQANIDWKATLGGEWRQYEEIFPALNESRIDQISLECAGSRVPLSLLRLLPDKQLMVGAIQVTAEHIETPEEVLATLLAAAEHADLERIMPCTNCGMAPIAYEVALGKLRALGAGARLMRARYPG
ncbi:MAG: methionine synthase [Gammaproteobacteria bacterium]|nr:methionine synthase [Gammaproteobacteria bacterium]MCP5139272.1 methionine synthase [Chromatiales bacterium]